MVISLSVVIMAHPKRKAQVDHVLAALGHEVPVVWDQKNDRWDTGKRSMLAYDPGCSHHLVIQDDVLVCRDLIEGVKAALEHVAAGAPLCLYVGRRRPREHQVAKAAARANSLGASFITMHTLNWGPGIVVPTAAIPAMIAYSDKLTDIKNYDRRLSRYWELEAHVRVWYTWPSLLDHADGPSLVAGRLGTDRMKKLESRIAHRFVGESASALALDWSGPVVEAEGPFKIKPERVKPARTVQRPRPIPARRAANLVAFKHTSGRVVTVPEHSQRARQYRGLSHWTPLGGDT